MAINITRPVNGNTYNGDITVVWSIDFTEPSDAVWGVKYYDPGISDWWYWNNTNQSWQLNMPSASDRLPRGTRTFTFSTLYRGLQHNGTGFCIEVSCGNEESFTRYGVSSAVTFNVDNEIVETTTEEFTTIYVETKPVSDIYWTTAKLNGQLYNLGGYSNVNVSFRYRVKTPQGAWTPTPPQTKNTPCLFSANLSGLEMGTTYEVQARCEYEPGSFVYGDIVEFATLSRVPPTITTQPATEVGYVSAKLNGTLADKGDYEEVDVCFKFRVKGGNWQSTAIQEDIEEGDFEELVTGLLPYSDYEFKAVAVTEDGTVEGEVKTFRTSLWRFVRWEEDYQPNADTDNPITIGMERSKIVRAVFQLVGNAPEVMTLPATEVGSNKATLQGRLVSKGDYSAEDFYVCFRYREYGMEWIETDEVLKEEEGDPDGNFSYTILGLKPETRYQFMARLRFLGEVIYGDILEFITEAG